MGRGRALRTKRKEARVLAEASALGEGVGKQKAHKKKSFEQSFKEHIGKAIDRIDPIKAVAILGLTIFAKVAITANIELTKLVLDAVNVGWLTGSPFFAMIQGLKILPTPSEVGKETLEEIPDWLLWLVSFALAYIIVEHGDILFAEGGSIQTAISSLLGA